MAGIDDLLERGANHYRLYEPAEKPAAERTMGGTLSDAGISLLKGAIAVPEAAVGAADMVTGGAAGRGAEAIGFRPKEAKAMLDEGYSAPQKEAFRRVQAADGLGDTFVQAVSNPSVIAHSVLESLPLMGAGGVVARGGLALAPRMGGAAAGAMGEGAVSAGSAAEQFRQATPDGTLTGEQAALAGVTGVATGMFSVLGARVAKSLGVADVDTMLAGAATNPAVAKSVTRRVLEGAFSEGVLEELPQSISEQVLQNVALGKPLDDGVNQAAVLGLLSGGVMGGGVNVISGAPHAAVAPPRGPLTRAAQGVIPEPPPTPPTPVAAEPAEAPQVDPVLEQIKTLTGTAKEEALHAYAIINNPNAAKGVQQYNKKLLDRHLSTLTEKPAADSTSGADLLASQPADPLQAALRQKQDEGASRAHLAQWMQRAEPLPLDQAQALKASALAERGVSMEVVPHGAGRGYTVVPSEWLAPSLRAEVPQGVDSGLLPMDTQPTGVLRADAAGNVAAETGAQRIDSAAAQAAIDAEAQRKAELGLTPDVEAAQSGIARPVVPKAPIPDLMNKNGQPFTTKGSATRAQKNAGTGAVTQVEGGWVVRMEQPQAPAASPQASAAPSGADTVATNEQNPTPATASPQPEAAGVEAPAPARVDPAAAGPAVPAKAGDTAVQAAGLKPLSLGPTPNSAEPVTVKDGIVYIGKSEALDFETGEPVKVPEGAGDAQIKQALKDAGAVSRRQKFYGGLESGATVAAVPQDKPAESATSGTMGDAQALTPAVEKLRERLESGGAPFIDSDEQGGQRTQYFAKGIGTVKREMRVPLELTDDERRAARRAENDLTLADTPEERAAAKQALVDALTPATRRAAGIASQSTAPAPEQPTAPVKPEVKGKAAPEAAKDSAGSDRLGRDNIPLSDGGKPYKTRNEATRAKRKQPIMRVVSVPGGFALAEKTEKQLAAESLAARRLSVPRTSPKGVPIPAHAFIAADGGLQPAARREMSIDGNPQIGNRTLFAKDGAGMTIERATEQLIEAGYLPEGSLHRDAYDLIRRSMVDPQYTAEGFERMQEIERETRFADYQRLQQEAAENGEEDPFPLPADIPAADLKAEGYDEATAAVQAEVNALIAQADAGGIDIESILEDIARVHENASPAEYLAAARAAIGQAITESREDRSGPAAAPASAREEASQGLSRDPAPFDPQRSEFTLNGKDWRVTIDRYWKVPIAERYDPDLLTWSVERKVDYGRGVTNWESVRGDDVPKSVAKKASEFHEQALRAQEDDLLAAPSVEDILAQQQRVEDAAKLDERERIDREAAGQTITAQNAPDQRNADSGDMFAREKAQAEIDKRNAGKPADENPDQVAMFSRVGVSSKDGKSRYDKIIEALPKAYRNDPRRRPIIPSEAGDLRVAGTLSSRIEAINKDLRGEKDRKGHGPITLDGVGNLVVDARDTGTDAVIDRIAPFADELDMGLYVTGVPVAGIERLTNAGFEAENGLGAIASRALGEKWVSIPSSVYEIAAPGTIMSYRPRGYSPILFSRGASEGKPLSVTQIQRAVDKLTLNWLKKPDIHILESMDDAPEPVRKVWQRQNSQGAVGEIEGFHWKGGVYLVADAMNSGSDVIRVLYHESLGHFGLRQVFGDRLDAVLRQVAIAKRAEMKTKAAQYGFDLTNERQRMSAAEELLSEMAQSRPEHTMVQKAIAIIRTFLRESVPGFASLKLTDAEILENFLIPARRFVEKGLSGRVAFTIRGEHGPETMFALERKESAFAAEVMNELAGLDETFRHPVSKASDLAGVFAEVDPTISEVGDATRADEATESGADKRTLYRNAAGKDFYVYEKGRKVWIDVSRGERWQGGDSIYHAVANYAHNTGRQFVGDPAGLSEDAIVRRTYHMLGSALRFGTTAHFQPAKEQIKGVAANGIAPLEWSGNDGDKLAALVESFTETVFNQNPKLRDYRYDFDRGTFADARGNAVSRKELLDVAARGGSGAAVVGGRAAAAGVLLDSLARAPSGQQPRLLALVHQRPGQLLDSLDGPLFSRGGKIVGKTSRVYTPEQERAMKNVGFLITPPTMKERAAALWKDAGKKLAQGLVDQFAPVKELDAAAYGLLRLSKGASGAFETLLHGGRLKLNAGAYDFDDSKRGGVIDRLLIPLGGEHHDFMRWVAANRAQRLMAEDREHLFTAHDIADLKTLADGTLSFDFTLQHGPRVGQTTRNRSEAYRDSLATFNEFNKNALDMAEESGLIDGASRKIWEHEFYVPFYRVAEEGTGGVRGMNIKSGVVRQHAFKQLKGGRDALGSDLLDNTLLNWAHLLDAAAKNRAAKATLEAAERMGIAIEAPAGDAQQIGAATGNKNGVVWFMDSGVKRFFVVDDPQILAAISGLEFAGMRGPMMDAMGKFKHILTVGVTASPFFKIRNLIRDSVQVIGTSQIGVNPAANVARGWKLTDPKSDPYFRLLAGGGTIHFGTMLEGNEGKRVQALVESGVKDSTILNSDNKLKAFYRQFIEPGIIAYNELGNRGEAINRATLYDQLVSQGVSHADASLQARDLMDFSMQGSFTTIRFLAQTVPFINARMQGVYKLGRGAKEDPARFAAVIGATALLSLGLLAAYGGDDDWKKRELWDRQNFWWFKFGGVAFRIPKPFEIGAIATLAEHGAELLMDDEMTGTQFRKAVLKLAGDNLSMNPIPQLAKPMLDVYANVNSFTGRPIESMGMERLKSEYRFNQRTSMAARGASTAMNAVTGLVGAEALSPVQIDHLLRGYFGWLGSFVVGAGDVLARPATGQIKGPTPDYWKAATGGMVSDLRDAPSRYVSQMYEQARELEQVYGTWKALQKDGKPEEAAAFKESHEDDLRRHKNVERVKRGEALLNQQIKRIEKSGATADEKRERIREVQQRKERLARTLAPA
jgi:hypothetical protein